MNIIPFLNRFKRLRTLTKTRTSKDPWAEHKRQYNEQLEHKEEERERLKEIYTSDLYQYKYETDKQKVVKQIYPNNNDVQFILGFYKGQQDGYRMEQYHIDKYVPDHYVYKLNNDLKLTPDVNKVKSQLFGISAQFKHQKEEVLNRTMRRHLNILEKTSPTIPDKFGDNLHWGLLVVEQDPEQNISKEVFEHSWDAIISRIAIVETPWVQTILEGDGSITTKKGTDTRLHVYLQALNPKQGQDWIEDRLKMQNRKQQLNDFLTK